MSQKKFPMIARNKKNLLSIIYIKRKVNIQNHHSFLLSYTESSDKQTNY